MTRKEYNRQAGGGGAGAEVRSAPVVTSCLRTHTNKKWQGNKTHEGKEQEEMDTKERKENITTWRAEKVFKSDTRRELCFDFWIINEKKNMKSVFSYLTWPLRLNLWVYSICGLIELVGWLNLWADWICGFIEFVIGRTERGEERRTYVV